MSAYRFCRSDDVALLIEAHHRCFGSHFPEQAPLTREGFKQAARELDLWTSSCMVAHENEELVAVLLAAKRERENLLYRIGVHPDHLRRGHGRHLVDSLRQKLAILGPPRIVAEVPAGCLAARQFLEACGYEAEATYTDYQAAPRGGAGQSGGLLAPVTVEDLARSGALDASGPRCWQRSVASLHRLQGEIRGLALASDLRIEGFVLYRDSPSSAHRDIMAIGSQGSQSAEPVLRLLLQQLLGASDRPVRLQRSHPEEIAPVLLLELGFGAGQETIGYAISAAPG